MNIGPTELIIILVIALIVFGPRKLPELGKSLGQAMAQFRRASDDFKRSWEQEVELEKTRLSEIKSDIESTGESVSYDQEYQASNSYGSEPGETDSNDSEEIAESSPEPAGAAVAHSTETQRSEHWI
ncbi:MAG: twin-arginine translocase TatA/TatE family subunit [Acidobacteria bacterium]|nr:twin-arginine translocase TatA/TatE family subunit [Acidobacteriota bacterium]